MRFIDASDVLNYVELLHYTTDENYDRSCMFSYKNRSFDVMG